MICAAREAIRTSRHAGATSVVNPDPYMRLRLASSRSDLPDGFVHATAASYRPLFPGALGEMRGRPPAPTHRKACHGNGFPRPIRRGLHAGRRAASHRRRSRRRERRPAGRWDLSFRKHGSASLAHPGRQGILRKSRGRHQAGSDSPKKWCAVSVASCIRACGGSAGTSALLAAALIIHVAGSARPSLAHLHPTEANRPCHRNLLPSPGPRSHPADR